MKLFLVGDFPEDNKAYGGVQGVLVNMANELIKRSDIELVLVSTSSDSGFSKFENTCSVYRLSFRSSFLKARKEFNDIVTKEEPDIIHLQGVVPGVLLYRSSYRNFFVVTQHAILSEERLLQVTSKRKILFKIKEKVEDYYLNKIKNIIFISEYNKGIYFKKNGDSDDVNSELIVNPVNEIFYQNTAVLESQVPNEMYFVGEIKKRKGLHILIQALHLLDKKGIDSKLHVIGGYKEMEYKKEIDDLISSLNISEKVIFGGWKNQSEVLSYAQNIPVFVLPSFQETLPLSIAEAMTQGKIVVATDICGIPEMIKNHESGYLFPKGDSEKLAEVLAHIFQNPDKQKVVSDNAKLASKRFQPETVIERTINFYERILSK
ncbi:glycosyltransferase family 4 protein [Zobellia nedashkovskayae]|uniref:glycosyltransferase family 4 protein n=1 Tax=Zobellia nedashkovskayae TaxID=2779510 RepID=UPI00188B9286|nr:glycosyltransferase family 4 protein [Zobellia nedashkovskayae]